MIINIKPFKIKTIALGTWPGLSLSKYITLAATPLETSSGTLNVCLKNNNTISAYGA